MRNNHLSATVLLIVTTMTASAHATSFLRIADGDFDAPGAWSPFGVPGPSDEAIMLGTRHVNFDNNPNTFVLAVDDESRTSFLATGGSSTTEFTYTTQVTSALGFLEISGFSSRTLTLHANDFFGIGNSTTSNSRVDVLNGGVIDVPTGILSVGGSGAGSPMLDVENGGTVTVDTLSIPRSGTIEIEQNGSVLTARRIIAGSTDAGSLTPQIDVNPGGTLTTDLIDVDSKSTASGTMFDITVGSSSSNLSTWIHTGPLNFDARTDPNGKFHIESRGIGALIDIQGDVTFGPGAKVQLNGGTLRTTKLIGSTGTFNWLSGELHITSPDGVTIQDDTQHQSFGSHLILQNRTLRVDHATTIDPGGTLEFDDGQLITTQLILNGGLITGNTLDLDQLGGLTGHGTADLTILAADPATTIDAQGPLNLGNTASPAYNFNGTLNLNTHHITINHDARATLGSTTNLGNGAQLSAPNGLLLAPSTTLNATANATINADFINTSNANGPTTPDQWLSFANTLSGTGDYTGNIQIQHDYHPGASTAFNNFTGNLSFTPSATLNIELLPATIPFPPIPGTDHDVITIDDTVTLDGTLNLIPLPDNGTIADTFPQSLGDQYIIISYGTRTPGSFFHNINNTLINTNLAFAPLLTDSKDTDTLDDHLLLRVSIPGDLNLDNKVTLADLSTFALNFNTTPGLYNELTQENSWQLGDFNTDGAITVADLSLLALNFGFDATDPTATPTPLSIHTLASIAGLDPASIPEPATATLILLLTAHRCTQRPTHTKSA